MAQREVRVGALRRVKASPLCFPVGSRTSESAAYAGGYIAGDQIYSLGRPWHLCGRAQRVGHGRQEVGPGNGLR